VYESAVYKNAKKKWFISLNYLRVRTSNECAPLSTIKTDGWVSGVNSGERALHSQVAFRSQAGGVFFTSPAF